MNAIAFSPDGETLATGSSDATVRLWKIVGRNHLDSRTVLEGHGGAVNAMAFNADGTTLATTGTDQTVRLWDLKSATADVRTRLVLSPP